MSAGAAKTRVLQRAQMTLGMQVPHRAWILQRVQAGASKSAGTAKRAGTAGHVGSAKSVGNPGRAGIPQVSVTATTSTRYALAASPRSTSWYKEEGL